MEKFSKNRPGLRSKTAGKIKILAFALFFVTLCTSGRISYAEGNSVPKWEDFCPDEFLNAKVLTRDEYCAKFPSLLPPLNSTIKEYNGFVTYWQERKEHFYEYLKACEALPANAKGVCYSKLEESQYAENKKWNDSEKARIKKEKDNTNRLKTGEFRRLNNTMQPFGMMY